MTISPSSSANTHDLINLRLQVYTSGPWRQCILHCKYQSLLSNLQSRGRCLSEAEGRSRRSFGAWLFPHSPECWRQGTTWTFCATYFHKVISLVVVGRVIDAKTRSKIKRRTLLPCLPVPLGCSKVRVVELYGRDKHYEYIQLLISDSTNQW